MTNQALNFNVYEPIENVLLAFGNGEPSPIFIMGAPRTGSTYLYQLLVKSFGLPYISNITNAFYPSNPILGLAMHHGISVDISMKSEYGKVDGVFQPSEGSGPMTHWFGGGHPSQIVSSKILPGKEAHFRATLSACEYLYGGAPMVIKNAWNCFRISYLASALPAARFIWIKRDIGEAAASDLEARYITKDSALKWNSATPRNLDLLRLRPPTEQVVENQFEFNQAIEKQLIGEAHGRWRCVWFEDLVEKPDVVFDRLSVFLGRNLITLLPAAGKLKFKERRLRRSEVSSIEKYIENNLERLQPYCYSVRDINAIDNS